MTKRTATCLLVVALLSSNSLGQSYRNQDAGLGGLAGAVLGGIIGHQNDETAEGALIGGAVGAIAGGLIGTEKDRQVQAHHRYHQQRVRYSQYQAWQRQARAVTINDVVRMSQSGVSDSVILNQIRTNGVADRVQTREIIEMHNQGVSEGIITAMQDRSVQRSVTRQPPVISQPPTVIVEKRPPPVIVHEEVQVIPVPAVRSPHYRIRYSTRPAFPSHPGRFRTYW